MIYSSHYFIQAPDTGRTVYLASLEPSLHKDIAKAKLAPFLKELHPVQVWNTTFESSVNMNTIETQEVAKDFKVREIQNYLR